MSFHTRVPQGIPDHMLLVSLAENRSANHTPYSSLSPGVARGNAGSRERKSAGKWQRRKCLEDHAMDIRESAL